MRQRSDEFGVAEVQWIDMGDGSHTGIASGEQHTRLRAAVILLTLLMTLVMTTLTLTMLL